MNKHTFWVAGSVSLFFLVVWLVPIEIPYTISTSGVVLPVNEWTLSRTQGGNLVSSLKDNRTGKLKSYSVSVFQRGDEATFLLNPRVYRQLYLSKGDTVATMYSNKDEERLVQLQGELAIQQSELRFFSTGQKSADVQGVANRTALAKQQLETQRRLTERTIALYKDSLASSQEYELAINQLRVRELDVKTAEAGYQSATTGAKPEQIHLAQAKIKSLEQQIQQIKDGLKDLTLIAPMSGAVTQKKEYVNPAEELLLSVADTAAFVVLLPVDYLEKDYVDLGQTVEIAIKGTTRYSFGKIIGIDNTAQIVDGRQAFFITALFEEKNLPVIPGMFLKTTVRCQPVTIGQYVARSVNLFFVN
jgi:hypothetical protein